MKILKYAAIVLFASLVGVSYAGAANQAGQSAATQDAVEAVAASVKSPNEASGDGVPNDTQDTDKLQEGADTSDMDPVPTLYMDSPAEDSGDGIPNAQQDSDYGNEDSPNELSGDGVSNSTQDEEYGQYGDGASPVETSGDGIPNAQQDDEFGKYGGQQDDADDAMNDSEDAEGEDGDGESLENHIQTRNTLRHIELKGTALMGETSPVVALSKEIEGEAEVLMEQEQKMLERGAISRFFFGGDEEAAEAVSQIVTRNIERIQEMKNAFENCENCDPAEVEDLQSQVQTLEEEQNRLNELAEKEASKKGLFGFLFGWIG